MIHKTVLLHETIDGLDIKTTDIVVDGTLGGGGHSEEILKYKHPQTLICLDLDEDAIERAKNRLESLSNDKTKVTFLNRSFRDIDKIIQEFGFNNIDKMLLDLGLSSHQLEVSGRGFSFQKDEPLKMTFGNVITDEEALTAYDVVNDFEERNLADIIFGFGDERFSRRIAKAIVEARKIGKIETTIQLSNIIKSSVPFWYKNGSIHPATKTFQAIRITVNDELTALEHGIRKGFELLSVEGRLAVISFHSLEDRIVKNFFKKKVEEVEGIISTKKPIVPAEEEIKNNPRSRSSKLRIITKIK